MTPQVRPQHPVTLITGASSGLGAEMARQLSDRGHHLVLGARRTERREELRAEITGRHPRCRVETFALDVTDAEATREVVQAARAAFGVLDKVVVNAGLGKGYPIGKGRPEVNRETATTNFLGALATSEAAMEAFRAQGHGHLVMISSMSAFRGMPGHGTVYAATKAGVAALAEGIRAEMLGEPGLDVRVSTIYPGYIQSEMNDRLGSLPFMVDTRTGVAAMVEAIEAERPNARVPAWPWVPMGTALRHLPLTVVRRITG